MRNILMSMLICLMMACGVGIRSGESSQVESSRGEVETSRESADAAALTEVIGYRALTSSESSRERRSGAQPAPSRHDATDQDRIHKFQTQFEKATADPSWSRDTEQRIVSNLAETLPADQRLLNVTCRTRLCRVEIQVLKSSTEHAPSDALARSMLFWGGPGEICPLLDEGGNLRLVMFLGRDPRAMDL